LQEEQVADGAERNQQKRQLARVPIELNQCRHCARAPTGDEAIHCSLRQPLDCFAEPVLGTATSGRTRWLAMTGQSDRNLRGLDLIFSMRLGILCGLAYESEECTSDGASD